MDLDWIWNILRRVHLIIWILNLLDLIYKNEIHSRFITSSGVNLLIQMQFPSRKHFIALLEILVNCFLQIPEVTILNM